MIIDSHVHIGKYFMFDMKKEDVLYSMERYGISYSIVSDIRAAEFSHDLQLVPQEFQVPQIKCAESVIEFAKEHPDKIGASVWVKPYGEKADEQLYELIRENRQYIKAMKVHPYHSTVPFDSKIMEPYMDIAEHFGLTVVTHTGGSDAASCVRVYNMAKRRKNINFVMVHMGLGTDNSEAEDLIGRLYNLYGDTTWVPMENVVRFIKRNGENKLIFGSDNPIDGKDTYLCNRTGDRSIYQDYFHKLPDLIPYNAYEKLMYKNSERLFGISLH